MYIIYTCVYSMFLQNSWNGSLRPMQPEDQEKRKGPVFDGLMVPCDPFLVSLIRLAWEEGLSLWNHAAFGPQMQGEVRGPGAGDTQQEEWELLLFSPIQTLAFLTCEKQQTCGLAFHFFGSPNFFSVSSYEERAWPQNPALFCCNHEVPSTKMSCTG